MKLIDQQKNAGSRMDGRVKEVSQSSLVTALEREQRAARVRFSQSADSARIGILKACEHMHLLSDSNSFLDLGMVERLTGVSPELVLSAYEHGQFPMAEDRDAKKLSWIEPSERGVIKVAHFHIPKRLVRTLKAGRFGVTANLAFDTVVESCGSPIVGREDTWINDQIRLLYGALHRMGFAHSIEVWDGNQMVGGLYGLSLGGTFFGESMFSTARDASKVALVHLVARMAASGQSLLDCQFYTRHLGQFGAIEIPEEAYLDLLASTQDRGVQFSAELSDSQLHGFLWDVQVRKQLTAG